MSFSPTYAADAKVSVLSLTGSNTATLASNPHIYTIAGTPVPSGVSIVDSGAAIQLEENRNYYLEASTAMAWEGTVAGSSLETAIVSFYDVTNSANIGQPITWSIVDNSGNYLEFSRVNEKGAYIARAFILSSDISGSSLKVQVRATISSNTANWLLDPHSTYGHLGNCLLTIWEV